VACYNVARLSKREAHTMRGGAVAARRAHNPKVPSSNLGPATIFQTTRNGRFWFKNSYLGTQPMTFLKNDKGFATSLNWRTSGGPYLVQILLSSHPPILSRLCSSYSTGLAILGRTAPANQCHFSGLPVLKCVKSIHYSV
jgi:hypothetical protein